MEVSQSDQARKGDVLLFTYTLRGFGKQGQIESLINKFDTDIRWKVLDYSFENDSILKIKLKILINPFPIIVMVAAIGAIGAGLFCWLSLDKVEKITESPTIKYSILGAVIIGLYFVYRSL